MLLWRARKLPLTVTPSWRGYDVVTNTEIPIRRCKIWYASLWFKAQWGLPLAKGWPCVHSLTGQITSLSKTNFHWHSNGTKWRTWQFVNIFTSMRYPLFNILFEWENPDNKNLSTRVYLHVQPPKTTLVNEMAKVKGSVGFICVVLAGFICVVLAGYQRDWLHWQLQLIFCPPL